MTPEAIRDRYYRVFRVNEETLSDERMIALYAACQAHAAHYNQWRQNHNGKNSIENAAWQSAQGEGGRAEQNQRAGDLQIVPDADAPIEEVGPIGEVVHRPKPRRRTPRRSDSAGRAAAGHRAVAGAKRGR